MSEPMTAARLKAIKGWYYADPQMRALADALERSVAIADYLAVTLAKVLAGSPVRDADEAINAYDAFKVKWSPPTGGDGEEL